MGGKKMCAGFKAWHSLSALALRCPPCIGRNDNSATYARGGAACLRYFHDIYITGTVPSNTLYSVGISGLCICRRLDVEAIFSCGHVQMEEGR